MFIPSVFQENRPEEIKQIIQHYPLANLIYHDRTGQLDATHLPFYYNQDKVQTTLDTHIAKQNHLAQPALDGKSVLLIFKAEDAYISPNWYPHKAHTRREFPTWDYQAVHVHGILHHKNDRAFIANTMEKLTDTHEQLFSAQTPWKISQTDPLYLKRLMAHVVGIEIEISRIEAISKLSQNKTQQEREGVIQALYQQGKKVMALNIERSAARKATTTTEKHTTAPQN